MLYPNSGLDVLNLSMYPELSVKSLLNLVKMMPSVMIFLPDVEATSKTMHRKKLWTIVYTANKEWATKIVSDA